MYEGGGWKPLWSARLVNSRLLAGKVLTLSSRQQPRAPILGAAGVSIVATRPVVNVGIEPKRVRDLPLLVSQLHAYLGVAAAPLGRSARRGHQCGARRR